MNTPFFIAKKVISNPSHSFSKLIIKIAIVAIALGMTVMIVATSLISGFKSEITGKIFGFWGHIHIMDFEATSSNSYEVTPMSTEEQEFYPSITDVENFSYIESFKLGPYENEEWLSTKTTKGGIRHIQSTAQKIGVIKTKNEIEGIVLKGIGDDYDWENLEKFLIKGERINTNDTTGVKEIIISEQTSDRLELDIADPLLIYFVKGESQLSKKFIVKGIYKTGLEEYDARFALIDLREIQKINGWDEDEVSGFELFVEHLDDMNPIRDAVYDEVPMNIYVSTIEDVDPNIFGWLELQNVNERVILILMLIVGIINMITALIILILERTNMIGILKALGGNNWMIQKIFLYYGAYITLIGLLLGNVVGIGLCLLQKWFGLITLPEEDYYVSVAPIDLDFLQIIVMNLGTLAITVLILIIPSFLVRVISPVKAIRFK